MAFFEDKETEEVNNSLWVEKYRPQKLDEYVGNEHLKTKVADYLQSGDVPHLLFFGKAGTGKTTLAKLIVNTIDCDHIIINASDEEKLPLVLITKAINAGHNKRYMPIGLFSLINSAIAIILFMDLKIPPLR